MLIPMPTMPAQIGPPSQYALTQGPWVAFVLTLQSIVCMLRMLMLLDIMGGFLMAIMIGLGYFAWREDMNITTICYWGVLCAINGLFDAVKVIDYLVKLRGVPLFSSKLPLEYNLAHATLIAIPVVTLMGVPLAWNLYKDYTEVGILGEPPAGFHDYGNNPPPAMRAQDGGMGAGGGGAAAASRVSSVGGAAGGERQSLMTSSSGAARGSTFQAFGGQGQRLGGEPS